MHQYQIFAIDLKILDSKIVFNGDALKNFENPDNTDGLSGFPTAKHLRIQTNSRGVSGSAHYKGCQTITKVVKPIYPIKHTNSSTHHLQQLSVGNTDTSSPIQHLTNDPQSSLVKQQSRASITNIAQGDAHSVLDDTDFMFRRDRLYKYVHHKLFTCHFSSDGKLLACAGTDGMVLLWDVPSRKPLPTTLKQPHIITDIRFQPKSTFFAAACSNKIYFCDSTNRIHSEKKTAAEMLQIQIFSGKKSTKTKPGKL
ncbi:G-protein beta WD-40 repeat-containing protein [Artemisia annua]|uniref:G-protein beta WD-40 repeat-containing protein n=1 Tax=Artemisia annua TaxID=35608 RepID=A0A2U1NK51_ARTAN|nr:G-protein beta WD-40 repeat-containing protein [Artemisia annua]